MSSPIKVLMLGHLKAIPPAARPVDGFEFTAIKLILLGILLRRR
jgi:hypothetical protein